MNVFVTRPPSSGAAYVNEDLGAALVTASLRSAGHECRFEDALQTRTGPAAYVDRLIQAPERVLCVTVQAECYADEIFAMLGQVKASASDKIVIVGGHPMSTIDEDAFRAYPGSFDYIVRGDGERVAVGLVGALSEGRDLPECVEGISYAKGDRLQRFPSVRRNVDYDSLPQAARDVWCNGLHRPHSGSALITFARGCNHVCSFCSVVEFYGRSQRFWHPRQIDRFVEEVEGLRSRYGIHDFTIVDPNFLGQPEDDNRLVRQLVAELARLDGGVVLDIACRTDSVEPRLFGDLRRAGVRRVFLGLESGSASTLRAWRKRAEPDQGLRAARLLNELGIYVHVGFIMLTPTTTLNEIESNLDYLAALPYFDLRSLAAPLLPLHSVEATSGIPPDGILKTRSRIEYRYVFRDRRVGAYNRLVGRLCIRLRAAFLKLTGTMWTHISDDGAVERYAGTTRRLLEPCLAFARRAACGLRHGEDEAALDDELDTWLEQHEAAIKDAATVFVNAARAGVSAAEPEVPEPLGLPG
jgi:hypothetical protein